MHPGNFVPVFGNNQSASIPLPFDFEFGGQTFTAGVDNLRISTNGYASFDGMGESILTGYQTDNFIIPLPDDGPPYQRLNWFVAPFWDNLNPSASITAGVYADTVGTAPNRQMVIEWYQVPIHASSSSTAVTFEAVLFEGSNQILYQYKTLKGTDSDGSSATIGLEYNDGYSGVQYAYNQKGAVAEKQAIVFIPRAVGDTSSVPGCLETVQAGPSGGLLQHGSLWVEYSIRITGRYHHCAVYPVQEFSRQRHPATGCCAARRSRWIRNLQRSCRRCRSVTYDYSSQDVLKAGGNPKNMFLSVYDTETNQWEKLSTAIDTCSKPAVSAGFAFFGVLCVYPV